MTLPLCRFKPQTEKNSLTGFRSSHLDVCTSVEHAHPSYGHIVLHMSLIPDSLTHGVKFKPKFCTLILHQCMVSSLWAEPTKRERDYQSELLPHNWSRELQHAWLLQPASPPQNTYNLQSSQRWFVHNRHMKVRWYSQPSRCFQNNKTNEKAPLA
jgi:hypothetical protein